jgi:hypothetical protein
LSPTENIDSDESGSEEEEVFLINLRPVLSVAMKKQLERIR